MSRKPKTDRSPELPDEERAREVLDKVKTLGARLREIWQETAEACEPLVEDLIQTGCQDVPTIEHLLDDLLGLCENELGRSLFVRLCRHLWYIDPVAASDYVRICEDHHDIVLDGVFDGMGLAEA